MATINRGHVCHLCGVPFSVGRMRNALEPYAAAFTPPWCERYAGHWSQWAGGCGQSAGCVTAFHYQQILDDRAAKNCSFIDQERECILRYMNIPQTAKLAAGSALPDFDNGHFPAEISPSECIRVIPGSDQTEKLLYIGDHDFWRTNIMSEVIQRRLEEEGFIFGYTGDHRTAFPDGTFEHIAGPGCQAFGRKCGYSGHSITYDEISMCRVAQVLNTRGQPAVDQFRAPLVDDEDWERLPNAEWILGGLNHLTSRNTPLRTFPQRLPTRVQVRSETTWYWPADREMAMVFHPTCLEVFKRAAIRRYGTFDINKLGRWFVATCNFTIYRFPRHTAVKRGVRELWNHHVGDDWITANPCYIGGLESLMQKFSFQGITQLKRAQEITNLLQQDRDKDISDVGDKSAFVLLPTELRYLIFNALSMGTIANTALAYPVLIQTTREYICRHIDCEWPFIWEFWSRRPYSKWTTKRHCELMGIYKKLPGEQDRLWSPKVGGSGHVTDMLTESVFTESGFIPRPASFIDIANYTGLNFIRFIAELDYHVRKGSLKGLRNRQRIWDDCGLILDQIEMLQKHFDDDWDVFTLQESGRWNPKVSAEFEAILYGWADVRDI